MKNNPQSLTKQVKNKPMKLSQTLQPFTQTTLHFRNLNSNFSKKNNLNHTINYQPPQQPNKQPKFLNSQKKSRSHNKPHKSHNIESQLTYGILPTIKLQRKIKKGTFLQNWLDEALNSIDHISQEQKQTNNNSVFEQPLKNVQHFQLDRLYLQSQNISKQYVDKLYNSLYIYTHGIDKVFGELISSFGLKNLKEEGQSNNQEQNGTQIRLLRSFWKAFTKLLQNCSSYQTAYVMVQKKHLKNIENLRNNLIKLQKTSKENYQRYEDKILKLQRELQQQYATTQKLKLQYKILQSTYELTDQTFNEEVSLRLKFQEKINSIYTSYNQLKIKYENLLEKLQISNHFTMEQKLREDQLNKVIQELTIKCAGVEEMFNMQKRKVKDLFEEIQIKTQQIEDIKVQNQINEEKDAKGQNIIAELISKQKLLKVRLEQSIVRNKVSEKVIKQQSLIAEGVQKTVSRLRDKNDQLYQKISDLTKKLSSIQQALDAANYKIQVQQADLKSKLLNFEELSLHSQQKAQYIEILQNQNQNFKKQLESVNIVLEKNNKTLMELKAVKDKYERINELLTKDKEQLESAKQQLVKVVEKIEESNQGYKLMINSKDKRIKQVEQNIIKQREVNQLKLINANNILTKKQAIILTNNRVIEESKRVHQDKNYKIDKLEKQLSTLQNNYLRLKIELETASNLCQALKSQKLKTQICLSQISSKYLEVCKLNDQLKIQLESKKYTLKIKINENDQQVNSLISLVDEYKYRVTQKGDYINPMIYEDLRMQIYRFEQSINIEKKNIEIKNKKLIEKDTQIQNLLKQIQQFKIQQKLLRRELEEGKKQNQKKIQQLMLKEKKTKQSQDQQNQLRKELQTLKESSKLQVHHLKDKILKLQQQINIDQQQIKILNSKLNMEIQNRQRLQEMVLANNVIKESTYVQTIALENSNSEINKTLVLSMSNYQLQPKLNVQNKQIQTQSIKQYSNNINNQIKAEQSIIPKQKKAQKNKIQSKEYQRALKITYMRR